MKCIHCGRENREENKYCKYCGKPLTKGDGKKPLNIKIILFAAVFVFVVVVGISGLFLVKFIGKALHGDKKHDTVKTEKVSEEAIEDDKTLEEVEKPSKGSFGSDVASFKDADKKRTPLSGRSTDDQNDRTDEEKADPEIAEEAGQESEQEENKEYILPDSSSKRLDKSDVEGLTAQECRIARNEIYARHGRKFKDEELQRYFDGMDWYEGTTESDKFDESVLSSIELDNLKLILEYEKEEGYR